MAAWSKVVTAQIVVEKLETQELPSVDGQNFDGGDMKTSHDKN